MTPDQRMLLDDTKKFLGNAVQDGEKSIHVDDLISGDKTIEDAVFELLELESELDPKFYMILDMMANSWCGGFETSRLDDYVNDAQTVAEFLEGYLSKDLESGSSLRT